MTSILPDDPWGEIKSDERSIHPSAEQVKDFHSNSDADGSVFALHHTLGVKHTQSPVGDHNHDGSNSRKIGAEMNLSISGTKNTEASEDSIVAMLKNVIEFADNRV